MQTLWAIREWFLSGSQYHGGEWLILFLGIAYLWLVFRTGVFGTRYGPEHAHPLDAVVALLTVIVLECLAA